MLLKPVVSTTVSVPAEVLSRPLNSLLAEVYKTEEFKNEWANDVRFHVARNLLHLRRFRKMSQTAVANTVGTSQSAVARIESAQENITLDTLQRFIVAMKGRLDISIPPQEYSAPPKRLWWDAAIRSWIYWQDTSSDKTATLINYQSPNKVMTANTLAASTYQLLPSWETQLGGI